MTTAALKVSRPEYEEYSVQKFRAHVIQEVKYQKFVNYLNEKQEKEEQAKRAAVDQSKINWSTIKAQQEQRVAEQEAHKIGKRLRTG